MWGLLLVCCFASMVAQSSSSNVYLKYNTSDGKPEVCKLERRSNPHRVPRMATIEISDGTSSDTQKMTLYLLRKNNNKKNCTIVTHLRQESCNCLECETSLPCDFSSPTNPLPQTIPCQKLEPPKLMLIRENKTWEDALEHCRERGMELVSILNEDKLFWVEMETRNATSEFVWLGLRYTSTLNFWFWVADYRLEFCWWAEGGAEERFGKSAAMETTRNHHWFAKSDLDEFNFICE